MEKGSKRGKKMMGSQRSKKRIGRKRSTRKRSKRKKMMTEEYEGKAG